VVGKGLRAHIKKTEEEKIKEYTEMTYGELDKYLVELGRSPGKSARDFVVMTGEEGMFLFDLALSFPNGKVNLVITGYVHRMPFKHSKSVYLISLFEKHGRYKVILTRGQALCFALLDGTTVLCRSDSTDSLNDAINNQIILKGKHDGKVQRVSSRSKRH
jgi:hypothetical protein